MHAIHVPLRAAAADGLFTKRAQGSLPQTEQHPVIFLPQFRNKDHIKDTPKCVTNEISNFSNNQIFIRDSHELGNKHYSEKLLCQ